MPSLPLSATPCLQLNTVISSPRIIDLKPPLIRLVFDRDEGVYRSALYRRIHRDKTYKTVRDTCRATKLEEMVLGVFGREYHDETTREVYNYIRSTEWGRNLP